MALHTSSDMLDGFARLAPAASQPASGLDRALIAHNAARSAGMKVNQHAPFDQDEPVFAFDRAGPPSFYVGWKRKASKARIRAHVQKLLWICHSLGLGPVRAE